MLYLGEFSGLVVADTDGKKFVNPFYMEFFPLLAVGN